jgi:hypothetical protein
MTAIRVRRRRRGKPLPAASEPALCGCGVRVDADERLHLINACAFFRAERFREADPASIRAADVRKAARDVDAALSGRPGSRKR